MGWGFKQAIVNGCFRPKAAPTGREENGQKWSLAPMLTGVCVGPTIRGSSPSFELLDLKSHIGRQTKIPLD